jgi:hypothetical protein
MRTIIGSTANWAADDIIIGDGEIAAEKLASGRVKLKVGDGLQRFSTLPYVESDFTMPAPSISPLAFAAIMSPDFGVNVNFEVTLTGAAKLDNPRNFVPGQSGAIAIKQDGTGSHVMTYGTAWKFEGGAVPPLTTDPNALDVLTFWVESPTRIVARLIQNSK